MTEAVEIPEPQVEPEIVPATTQVFACEDYRSLVEQYDWDSNIMLAIMEAENRGCDTAVNNHSLAENHGVCIGSYGLLQVGCIHFSGEQDPNDSATNIAVAYQVWLKQGYNAWTQYQNGAYLEFY